METASNPFNSSRFESIAEDEDEEANNNADDGDPISSMCQQLSQELSMLSTKEEKSEATSPAAATNGENTQVKALIFMKGSKKDFLRFQNSCLLD